MAPPGRILVTAAWVGVPLAERAVHLLDDVLDTAVARHIAPHSLRLGLRVRRVGRPLASLDAVLPNPTLVVCLDIAQLRPST